MSSSLPPVLGPSEQVGVFEDGSPQWHAQRATGIGGSEIASVCQVPGAFKSRYMLWLEKSGAITPEAPSPRLRRLFAAGHALEPVVVDEFALLNPQYEIHPAGSWARTDHRWALSNPDRILRHRDTGEYSVLEIKTSGRGYGFDDGFPPAKYVSQCRWYAGNLGLASTTLVALVALGDYAEWLIPTASHLPVTRLEDGEQEFYGSIYYPGILEAGAAFVQSLAANVPPPLDGAEDTFEHLRASNPGIDELAAVDIPLELAVRLHRHQAQAKESELIARQAKSEILQLMGDAKVALVDGVKVAYRQGNGRPTLYLARGNAVRTLVAGGLNAAA